MVIYVRAIAVTCDWCLRPKMHSNLQSQLDSFDEATGGTINLFADCLLVDEKVTDNSL